MAIRCFIFLLFALWVTALAIPIHPDTALTSPNPEVEKRAPLSSNAGDSESCRANAKVTFNDRYNIAISFDVTDTKADGNSVYGYLRVYDDAGYTDLPRVPNHSGHDKTITQRQTWKNSRGRITGVRANACVDVRPGVDKCHKGNFVKNPLS